jgi:DnaJ-class molecular chaperone
MMSIPSYRDVGCDTPTHDKYQAVVRDPECERVMRRQCLNVHRCGQSDADPCESCKGWGKLRQIRTGVIAFSLEGLFDDRPCNDCGGTGRAGYVAKRKRS